MNTFPLRIGTPDGMLFEGNVQRVVCRTITGDLAVLAGHCNMCTAVGMGEAHIVLDANNGKTYEVIVMNGTCRLLATTWEWKEDIDEARAAAAKERAEKTLAQGGLSERDYRIAQARLNRALVRLDVKR